MLENEKNKTGLKKWLDTIQQDSWQLELVISGVVIFLLLGASEPLENMGNWASITRFGSNPLIVVVGLFLGFLQLSYLLLIGMFLLHLSIRGIWIGAIGLRSVSGDFDYEELDYQPKFSKFLRKRLGNFDDYIAKLEKNASVTFSLAFLLFFAILSIGLFIVAIMLGVFLLTGPDGQVNSEDMKVGQWWFFTLIALVLIWVTTMMLAGLLYLIDFITFGWLKRRPWFHRVYYPFYRFLGWITLARLYRPIYYNIIDNPFGKRLVVVYALVAFLALLSTSFELTPFAHFSYAKHKAGVVYAGNYVDSGNYENGQERNYEYPSLGSRFAGEDYLEVFMPNNYKRYKNILKKRFPELRLLAPASVSFAGRIRLQDTPEERIDSTLNALSAIHRVYLNDSLLTNVRWHFYLHPVRKQPGLLYDLPVYHLSRGEYLVRFEEQITRQDSLFWREISTISFLR